MIQNIWTTATGQEIPFDKLDHQHLSNILWFVEVFGVHIGTKTWLALENLLEVKFGGQRLDWKPLPIPGELVWINKYCEIHRDGTIGFRGKSIGSIAHCFKTKLELDTFYNLRNE